METITGSFIGGGSSNKGQKKNLRVVMMIESKSRKDQYKPIHFIKDDFGDIDQAHNDPLVISTLIHNI